MKVITAPEKYVGQMSDRRLFLAGGITGAPDWQAEIIQKLEAFGDCKLVLFNPRRPGFNTYEKGIADEQVEWEHRHLHMADAISFWFPAEAKCMITLLELGIWMDHSRVIVGVHPEYERRFDVEKQLSLYKPSIRIVHSLDGLAFEIRAIGKEWEI
jgi:hypothetical protein